MAELFDIEQKISEIEAELANLDDHRAQLLDELTRLRQKPLYVDGLICYHSCCQVQLKNLTYTLSPHPPVRCAHGPPLKRG